MTATTGDAPIDMVFDRTGRVLYVLNGAEGSISLFRVGSHGDLEAAGIARGLPAGAVRSRRQAAAAIADHRGPG